MRYDLKNLLWWAELNSRVRCALCYVFSNDGFLKFGSITVWPQPWEGRDNLAKKCVGYPLMCRLPKAAPPSMACQASAILGLFHCLKVADSWLSHTTPWLATDTVNHWYTAPSISENNSQESQHIGFYKWSIFSGPKVNQWRFYKTNNLLFQKSLHPVEKKNDIRGYLYVL